MLFTPRRGKKESSLGKSADTGEQGAGSRSAAFKGTVDPVVEINLDGLAWCQNRTKHESVQHGRRPVVMDAGGRGVQLTLCDGSVERLLGRSRVLLARVRDPCDSLRPARAIELEVFPQHGNEGRTGRVWDDAA